MKNSERVKEILDELKNLAESDFELHRISVLEKDLTEPPKVEQIDETHQKFDGRIYRDPKDKHYCAQVQIHRDVWKYYFGEIPEGYFVHHRDLNPENNEIENLQLLTPSQHSRLHNKDKIFVRDCPVCGENFSTNVIGDIYCSRDCRQKAAEVVKICPICSSSFVVNVTCRERIYCSKECRIKAQEQRRIDELTGKTEVCRNCGKTFPAIQRFKGVFCSKLCQNRYHRKSNMETRKCVICGAEFSTYRYGKTQTCSQYCSKRLLLKNFPPKTRTCVCEICGKEFEVRKYQHNKTCSIECANELRRQSVLKFLSEQEAKSGN